MKTSVEFRIYVGTYAKYNDGSFFGKWMDLSDYIDLNDLYEACLELHQDEEHPELMFQDWEYELSVTGRRTVRFRTENSPNYALVLLTNTFQPMASYLSDIYITNDHDEGNLPGRV